MEAIEFVTKIEKGKIKVPEKYLDVLGKECRVILLVEKGETKAEKIAKKKKEFSAFKVKIKGLKFDRDEANER